MYTFALNKSDSDKETKSLLHACIMDRQLYCIKRYNKVEEIPDGEIAFGNIDWVQAAMKKEPEPNYYPDFLQHLLNRRVWRVDDWPLELEESVFIKPADKPKRYQHRKTTPHSYRGKKKGPHWCSEIISFSDEWRLYVADGKIVYSGWYYPEYGEEKNCPQKYIDEVQNCIPSGWCGSIDIGESNGRLTLVECGEPYSTGFYGHINEGKIYADWAIAGWKWMKENL